MFIQPSSGLIIPQTEHLKLAGEIASHWGNEAFDMPSIDHEAFVHGVTYHDQAFGTMDALSITGMTPEARHTILTQLVAQDLGNPASNIVALMHVLRLIGEDPKRTELKNQCLNRIDREIEKTPYLHHDFAWADPITELCDNISFDLCLEEPTPAVGHVYRQLHDTKTVPITYTINGSLITLDPWPLNVQKIEGSMVGYEQEGYPTSAAHKIPYCIAPASSA